MPYFSKLHHELSLLTDWMDLRKEQGADVTQLEKDALKALKDLRKQAEEMKPAGGKYVEPIDYKDILEERPKGPRKLELNLSDEKLYDKMLGGWLGRGAGCVLGIPVEGRSRDYIRDYAKELEQPYPLAEYWKATPVGLNGQHYSEPNYVFLKDRIDHIGPDDDLAYSVLGLLIFEEKGIDFTMEDVGEMWLKYLPVACTAEHVALENLKKGMKPPKTATTDNPYYEWIGADIRSDPWGYCAPGLPEMAADYAYRDASVSHIMNGTYGEMFFSAAIAAAFAVDTPKEALEIALTEIPEISRMAETVKETIKWCEEDGDWEKTYERFAKKYEGMSGAHTLNNACLTVMGLLYGEGDFEKTISYTVMGGVDTDCTGATAGSIMGIILGAKNLPSKWVKPFGDRLTTYLINAGEFSISDIANRCCAVAKKVRAEKA